MEIISTNEMSKINLNWNWNWNWADRDLILLLLLLCYLWNVKETRTLLRIHILFIQIYKSFPLSLILMMENFVHAIIKIYSLTHASVHSTSTISFLTFFLLSNWCFFESLWYLYLANIKCHNTCTIILEFHQHPTNEQNKNRKKCPNNTTTPCRKKAIFPPEKWVVHSIRWIRDIIVFVSNLMKFICELLTLARLI